MAMTSTDGRIGCHFRRGSQYCMLNSTRLTRKSVSHHINQQTIQSDYMTPVAVMSRHGTNGKNHKVNARAVIANPPANMGSGFEEARTRVRAVQQLQRLLEPSVERSTPLAYEIVAGSLVKWSENSSSSPSVPCCVLLHGMLGNRKNLKQLAKRLSDAFPAWMILLVDLRCHGDSSLEERTLRQSGEHSLPQAARDVLQTLSILGVYPRIVIGHR